jgi:hypothetical protein
MVGPQQISFGEVALFFICQEHSVFHSYSFPRVFSFSRTAFSFHFSPSYVFRSCYIFSSRCIFASGPYWFSSKELAIKSLNGVGKKKKLYAKKWYKKDLV